MHVNLCSIFSSYSLSGAMNEEILSFIWRYQYFQLSDLRTDEGYLLSIIRPGLKNPHSGPDFSNARVTIGGVEWAGTVEIHTKSSDWFQHFHEKDPAYESVILHVVWENDLPVKRSDNSLIPTLTLKGLVQLSVLERYNNLIADNDQIPCAKMFNSVADIHKITMLDRALLSRLELKTALILNLIDSNQQDWEEATYQWITQHFGFKLNDPVFLRLSQILPLKILLKHRNNRLQIEALLFGCAGLIPSEDEVNKNNRPDDYINALRREFRFLSAKYNLSQILHHEWKFMRLRPSGFPTVRIAQLAALISNSNGLFSMLTGCTKLSALQDVFSLKQSEYWQQHFTFYKASVSKVPFMGKDAAHLLIINAAIPLLIAYARQRQKPEVFNMAIEWLSQIPAENNHITRQWELLGVKVKTAYDSQALIQQYNTHCAHKQCLHCAVGTDLIRNS
jgi:hypothetical protein